MIQRLQVFKLFTLSILLTLSTVLAGAQTYKDGVRQGVVRVKLRPELVASKALKTQSVNGVALSGIKAIDALNTKYGAASMKRVFTYSPKHELKHQKYGLHLWYEVSFDEGVSPFSVASSYATLGEVMHAEPVYEKKVEKGRMTPVDMSAAALKASNEMPFNDPMLDLQWHYDNQGQTGGTPGADINLFDAWTISKGSSNVIVSVHDEGIDVNHDDLKANIWINEAELNGEPGVDDDGNGFKDDIYGFNFAHNKGQIEAGEHGTHVAGTIGAMNNNNLGVCGIAGGSGNDDGVKMMSCQILGGVGSGNVADSYVYAADQGAIISQNSWGYSTPGVIEQSVLDGIDYFINEAGSYDGSPMKGGVVLFASGNDDVDDELYPGFYENVVAISSVGPRNVKASYSNYGTWIDLSAPGGDLNENILLPETNTKGYSNGVLSTVLNNRYAFLDGTSMACPHVSGVAALIVAKHGGNDFTADMLKTHLLSKTNNIYDIEDNADYIGKLGVGTLNAVFALATDDGIAPDAISDLTIAGIAQDFATIQWTVPADGDDLRPDSYIIYVSKVALTEENVESAIKYELNDKTPVGESIEFEVEGLQALTEYHFAVKSVDRWGNKSALSNIPFGMTNAGPDAAIDGATSSMEITIDMAAASEGSSVFNILNTGEGLLRWNAEARHISSVDASNYDNSSVNYPPVYNPVGFSGRSIKKVLPPQKMAVAMPFAQETKSDALAHFYMNAGMYFLGESDTTITNSAATRYQVELEEGFNLTQVDVLLNLTETNNKVVLEVYKGENINSAQLLLAQEFDGAYGASGWNYITLDEQLNFKKGDVFWVAVHTPSGLLYPIGAGYEMEKAGSENCFISFNGGQSWARFEDTYYDNQWAWAMIAVSRFVYPDEYITLSPSSGEVLTDESVEVMATVDASTLINGTYKSNIVVNTNETDEPMLRVPFTVNVKGHQPIFKGEPVIDFGSVLLGNSKTITVTVDNVGYGKLMYPQLSLTNNDFVCKTSLPALINARESISFDITYTPTAIGNTNSTITLTGGPWDNPYTYTFSAFGVCAVPPELALEPAEVTYSDMAIGDSPAGSFMIKNNGQYPLHYVMPQYTDEPLPGETQGEFCKFGYYTQLSNSGDPSQIAWKDISGTGTELTDYNRGSYFYSEVPLGFAFPFFGIAESTCFITNYGLISFDTECNFNFDAPAYKQVDLPNRYISATGKKLSLSEGGKIYTQNFGDHFIIQWDKVIMEYEYFDFPTFSFKTVKDPYSYQIVLHNNGDVDVVYDYLPADQTGEFLVAMEDQNQEDGIMVSDVRSFLKDYIAVVNSNSSVRFGNPGLGLFSEVSNTSGTIHVGQSAIIDYVINTDGLNQEDYQERIVILSNDPEHRLAHYTANLNITNGGAPQVQCATQSVDFGLVYQGDVAAHTISLVNTGNATEMVTGVSFRDGDEFSCVFEEPVALKGGSLLDLNIGIYTFMIADLEDEITISLENGEAITIALSGKIIEAPAIEVSRAAIYEAVEAGIQVTVPVTVSNTGGNDLHVAPIGNEWMSLVEAVGQSADIPEMTYIVSDNRNDKEEVSYSWTDISSSGTHLDLGAFIEEKPFWAEVELPFGFTYYGNTYNKISLGHSGVLAFDNDLEVQYPMGDNRIPNAGGLNNYIAPLFGFVYFDEYNTDDYGVYYQAYEDRFVVQYHRLIDGFKMGQNFSLQVILYNNGTIKFQYNYYGNNLVLAHRHAAIGIENTDGTDGVLYSANEDLMEDGLAINFVPVTRKVIAANGSQTFDVLLDARGLVADLYSGELVLWHNAPGNSKYTMPVTLDVSGAPKASFDSAVEFGQVLVLEDKDAEPWESPMISYTKEFSIENNGTAVLEIKSFDEFFVKNVVLEAYVLIDEGLGIYNWKLLSDLASESGDGGNPIPGIMSETGVSQLWDPIIPGGEPAGALIEVQPGDKVKLRAKFTPEVATVLQDLLIVETNDATKPFAEISITGSAVLPPVFKIDSDVITVLANTPEVIETRNLVINNEGHSDLIYSMELEFQRESTQEAYAANMKKAMAQTAVSAELSAQPVAAAAKVKSATEDSFNRTLSHYTKETAETRLGYDGEAVFTGVTRYKAPNDGFNLTHVSTYFVPGSVLSSDIIIDIYGGSDDIHSATLLHSQTVNYTVEEADNLGGHITFELTEHKLFYPKEYFFVAFTYPQAVTHPQGYLKIDNPMVGQTLWGDGSGWWDVENDPNFAGGGWMMKAHESEFITSVWLEVDGAMADTVVAQESDEVKLNIDARYSDSGTNTANLVITTNDPYMPKKVVKVNLVRNTGPEYDGGKEVSFTITEEEVLEYTVVATDKEGDEFTLEVDANVPYLTSEVDGNEVKLTFTPDYDAAGLHQFNITGTDSYGNISTQTIYVNVSNVNRSPVLVGGLEDLVLSLQDDQLHVDVYTQFMDPDGDEMVMEINEVGSELFEMYKTTTGAILNPMNIGDASMSITVTDSEGARLDHEFTISVKNRVGINDIEDVKINVYPNPTSDFLRVQWMDAIAGDLNVRIVDASGAVIETTKVSTVQAGEFTLDVSSYPNGIYFLEVISDKDSFVEKFIKN